MEKEDKIEKHKHEWEDDYVDCPLCGGGQIQICSCGEDREKPPKKKKK